MCIRDRFTKFSTASSKKLSSLKSFINELDSLEVKLGDSNFNQLSVINSTF